ncbi:MAG: 50S ribosomal protein L25 [Armatimonadetes bacterium]|nr:50S ribosomal protein L25 [Armatimonadota bacterium]
MDITVTPRPRRTKGERKRRLRQGLVPGAIYGRGLEPALVEVPAKAIADVLLAESGMNTVINLTVQGDRAQHTVLIDNLERDPITRGFLNVGFHQVKKGDKVHAQVPITLVGTPEDVALNGALLEQTLESIDVHAQPADLPPHLEVDVSQMKTGDVLRVADLPHNPKIEFTTNEDIAIASVHVSRTAQDVEEADAAVTESALTGQDAVTELRADADRDSDTVTGAQGQP